MGVDGSRSFAGDHRAHHVTDGQRLRTFSFGFPLRRDRVRGFARLGDQHGESVGSDDGIAITPLAGVVNFNRNARHALDHELPGLSSVPAGSASGDVDFLRVLEFGFRDLHFVEEDVSGFLRNPSQRGVTHRAGLLVDFLEHEVLEAALFRHDRVPGHVLDLADDGLPVEVGELHAFGRNYGHVAVTEEKQVAGVIKDRRNVGGDEVLVLAQADNGGRAVAGSNNLVGLINCDYRQREYAGQLADCLADALFQRWAMTVRGLKKILLDQVRDHFGVGFGGELVAFFNQFALQRNVVLDNAVVHDDDAPSAITMGMRVLFRRPAMGGPAGVANAVGAIERLEPDYLFQVAQLALSAANLQAFAIAAYRDSGGIVAAIFQASKSLDDDRYHPFLANISHYAAHANAPIFGPGKTEECSCELEVGPHRTLVSRSATSLPQQEICTTAEPGKSASHRYSSREKRNSSITGLVRTSRAMRVTSASTSLRFRPPSSVSSKYLPWRTSSNPLHPIFFNAPWIVFPCGSRTLFLRDTYT